MSYRNEYPIKLRRQETARNTIEKRSPQSKTRRGLGTGKGKRKGSQHKIPHLVREVLHTANLMTQQLDREEAVRFLAAFKLAHPDVFREALRRAPRSPAMEGVRIKPAKLIRDEVLNLTMHDIAKHSGTTLATLEHVKHESPHTYRLAVWNALTKLLTPGEFELLRALQYRHVVEISDLIAAKRVLNSAEKYLARDSK